MRIESADVFFEKLFSLRGKTVAAPANFPPDTWEKAGAHWVAPETISLEKSVFENAVSLLAMKGCSWDIAGKSAARELAFWFDDEAVAETSASVSTGTLAPEERAALALARVCAANFNAAPLVVAPTLCLSDKLLEKLRRRASEDGFPAVLENAPRTRFPCVDEIVILKNAAQNLLKGKVLGIGAGEFFAELPSGTQIHGRLFGNVETEIAADSDIEIFLPPEIFRTDVFPPEENFFEVTGGGEIFSENALFYRDFECANGESALRIAAQHRQSLEIPAGSSLYAWFFPEDAIGFV